MNTKHKNPYMASYLSLACICCLALSIIFFYTNYLSYNDSQNHYNQTKIDKLADDWESQLSSYEDLALRFAISPKYQPYYFKNTKFNETLLLDDFEQYSHYAMLADEYFLYYGDDYIFHSTGETIDLTVYIDKLVTDVEDQQHMLQTLHETQKSNILTLSDNIYITFPFRVTGKNERSYALLCIMIKKESMEERFQLVSLGIQGNLSLYTGNHLIFCNQASPCTKDQEKVLTSNTTNGLFTFCYLPVTSFFKMNSLFPLQILLVLADVLLVILIAKMYAAKSYSPILEISNKYRSSVSLSEEIQYENALDEINQMMDNLLYTNTMKTIQIDQKQVLLRQQILQTLINGNYNFNIRPYLEKLQIYLPGPHYFAVSIIFESKEMITEDFLSNLLHEISKLTIEEESTFVYGICNYEHLQLSIICSITEILKKDKLSECICEVANSFSYTPIIGIGNTYPSLSSLSASWLESMDIIHNKLHHHTQPQASSSRQGYIYNANDLRHISTALSTGNEMNATKCLQHYIEQLNNEPLSLLMQQYVFTDFLSEITRLAGKHKIELSNQGISLTICAKNVTDFKNAAQYLIHDFCEKMKALKQQEVDDESYRIYEYINSHFTEYDLSIEKVASDLNTTTSLVRNSILKHTGKMYKDYLIFLRIEYAKILLSENDLTVAETCQKVGYGSIPYFITLFKEMTGVTPAKYKNNIQ